MLCYLYTNAQFINTSIVFSRNVVSVMQLTSMRREELHTHGKTDAQFNIFISKVAHSCGATI